jgi:hypothetical protein
MIITVIINDFNPGMHFTQSDVNALKVLLTNSIAYVSVLWSIGIHKGITCILFTVREY